MYSYNDHLENNAVPGRTDTGTAYTGETTRLPVGSPGLHRPNPAGWPVFLLAAVAGVIGLYLVLVLLCQ